MFLGVRFGLGYCESTMHCNFSSVVFLRVLPRVSEATMLCEPKADVSRDSQTPVS